MLGYGEQDTPSPCPVFSGWTGWWDWEVEPIQDDRWWDREVEPGCRKCVCHSQSTGVFIPSRAHGCRSHRHPGREATSPLHPHPFLSFQTSPPSLAVMLTEVCHQQIHYFFISFVSQFDSENILIWSNCSVTVFHRQRGFRFERAET